ncbi:putative serine/threonine-protein kinase ypk [Xylogone sp. PMI_703]|nr:putative serine/threonine-protein kinase ypk [Xylogone sp. PMI_703]
MATEPEILPVALQDGLEPGVLLVAIHEGIGLSVPKYDAAIEPENGPSNITPQSEGGLMLSRPGRDRLLYATLELDGSEFSVVADYGTIENPVWPFKDKFDIFRIAELTIRLYAKNLNYRDGSQDVLFLGCAKMKPAFRDGVQREWLPIENGTGNLHVEVEYVKNKTLRIETSRRYYLAPELLAGSASTLTDTAVSKWWTFGAFIFEMLTGLPPFYDEDVEQRRRNILSESLIVHGLLPASTQDLLNKLLTRKPSDRLGFNGASEIKAHRYFDGLDWDKVARREYEPTFKPRKLIMSFEQEGKRVTAKSIEEMFSGFTYQKPTPVESGPTVPAAVESQSHPIADEKRENWELDFQKGQSFSFYNRSTKEKKPIVAARSYQSNRPDKTQSQEALEAVLKNKYMHLVSTLLEEYGVDLNFQLGFTSKTPLDYVTGLQEVDIKGNQELVQMLVRRTDRIPCTRALGHAVSKQDTPTVNTLLANGVKCDFEEGDRPIPTDHYSESDFEMNATTMGDASGPEDYMPPLIRAIQLGDADMVRLLLAHGANVNIGYHGLSIPVGSGLASYYNRNYVECGRPVQLAMELGHEDLVRLLLENGANIDLPQPVWWVQPAWRRHNCKMIPREVYHQITARLRCIAASVALQSEEESWNKSYPLANS